MMKDIQRARPSVAIVGAGVSGLTVAESLQDLADVQVFEKSRRIGGRMATRFTDSFAFDYGAQFFTARTRAFKRFIMPYLQSGVADEWAPRLVTLQHGKPPRERRWFEPHWVAIQGMQDLCVQMAESLDVQLETRITALQQQEEGWFLQTGDGQNLGSFDWVVLSAPVPQALELLPEPYADYEKLNAVEMGGCFTLMLGLNRLPKLDFQGAVVKGAPIEWIAVNSHKPQRPDGISLIAHSEHEWTQSHFDMPLSEIQQLMVDEVLALLDLEKDSIEHADVQQWVYSRVIRSFEHKKQPFSIDPDLKLAVCGDGFGAGRVETAFTSGHMLSRVLHRSLKRSFMDKLLRRQ